MIQKPKGTKDIIQTESYKLQYVENNVKNILTNYCYKEIRTPVFESTELFQRGVGDTTDVVQKEMYTFDDKGGRSITLRPEGTAGVVRAYIENGMSSMPSPVKVWYNMAMYRYENVQKGRLREFHQIGAEVLGSGSYLVDVEAITMANDIFKALNIPNVELNINSIGCPECRAEYQNALREFIRPNLEQYCDTCKSRFERNPMRILDCKERHCKELNQGAPKILDYLCEDCKTHFENVKQMLTNLGIEYKIDPEIVRGLDYYTKTVFEFISKNEGYTVLAGGRYDGLVKELGGQDTPALGFAMGLERAIEIYEKYNTEAPITMQTPIVYIAQIGDDANVYATKLVHELREAGIYAEKDITGKSLNAQFKYANKIGAKYVITIGENELQEGKADMKDMATGEAEVVGLNVGEIGEKIKQNRAI